uniref:Uncharacterized protein n=1 Tax=Meloidogyne enterolobii TaxID=390850 RepID=A0A6V7UD42_MELEN|nr:unnamed protein product [Meloidogyne enterolobii]
MCHPSILDPNAQSFTPQTLVPHYQPTALYEDPNPQVQQNIDQIYYSNENFVAPNTVYQSPQPIDLTGLSTYHNQMPLHHQTDQHSVGTFQTHLDPNQASTLYHGGGHDRPSGQASSPSQGTGVFLPANLDVYEGLDEESGYEEEIDESE